MLKPDRDYLSKQIRNARQKPRSTAHQAPREPEPDQEMPDDPPEDKPAPGKEPHPQDAPKDAHHA